MLRSQGVSLAQAILKAREGSPPGLKVEVEAETAEEALEAARAGAELIMLDNMSPEDIKIATTELKGEVQLEASGRINLKVAKQTAQAGVDFISVGAITHSPKSLDLSLEICPSTQAP